MGNTSSDVISRWKKKNYKTCTVLLRFDEDQKIIDFVAKCKKDGSYSITDIFREGAETLMKEEE